MAGPGALKPTDGDGTESSRPLVYSLCFFYLSTSPSVFHFMCAPLLVCMTTIIIIIIMYTSSFFFRHLLSPYRNKIEAWIFLTKHLQIRRRCARTPRAHFFVVARFCTERAVLP